MPSTIRVSTEDGVTVVTLADPGRRNALSRELSDELAAAVADAVSGGACALVLAADPPVL
jgi:enoyl-CoA hydratase